MKLSVTSVVQKLQVRGELLFCFEVAFEGDRAINVMNSRLLSLYNFGKGLGNESK